MRLVTAALLLLLAQTADPDGRQPRVLPLVLETVKTTFVVWPAVILAG